MAARARRRGRAGPARCNTCRASIAFAGSPYAAGRRPINPTPLNGHELPAGVAAFPVFSGRAYRLPELVDLLMALREVGSDEAEKEARDLPWHTLHACDPSVAAPTVGGEGHHPSTTSTTGGTR